eukprot:GHRQ01028137.1.p2 GENE.GHRQ01028137.1~~GHRQ01028137.1.p2  ORF type:complete len:164 (-),score=64.15 GHRQ01028137.1:180-671(-)
MHVCTVLLVHQRCTLLFPHHQRTHCCAAAGAFENTVQAPYKYVVPKPREECTKTEQLTVSFAAGYIAGVFCAVVSHPADNLVSKLNAQKGATVGDIVKQMGWYALATRGLGLRIIMIGTLTGLQVRRGARSVLHAAGALGNSNRVQQGLRQGLHWCRCDRHVQ